MESTLHRQLKEHYGTATGGRVEVVWEGFRIDAEDGRGRLVEIQLGPLAALRPKLKRILPERELVVVKPVILARRIVRRKRIESPDLSARYSPKRGELIDAFDDLIGLARWFPTPGLTIELMGVDIDEVRVPRRRWPGYAVADRVLRAAVPPVVLQSREDLWRLMPEGLDEPFTTVDLAAKLNRPQHFAQRVAYCLKHAGAVDQVGHRARCRVYVRTPGASRPRPSRRAAASGAGSGTTAAASS